MPGRDAPPRIGNDELSLQWRTRQSLEVTRHDNGLGFAISCQKTNIVDLRPENHLLRGACIRKHDWENRAVLPCQSELPGSPIPASAFRKGEGTALSPVFVEGVAATDCVHADSVNG